MAIPEGYEKLAIIGIAYKGEYDPETEYHMMNAVYHEGSTYVALKEHPEGLPIADGANWMYLAKGFIQNMLNTINAKDTSGLLGEPGEVVNAQTLMDKIADKMIKELVTNTTLQEKLAGYILKNQIANNLLATQPGNVLDAMQGKILADKFAQLNSDIITAYNEIDAVYGTDKIICSLTLKPGHQYLILCNLTTSDSDSSSIMGASLKCVGDARVIGGATARTTMHSGGGCANWMFVEPTVDVTINLYGYGYSSKTYKYMGTLMAIQLR